MEQKDIDNIKNRFDSEATEIADDDFEQEKTEVPTEDYDADKTEVPEKTEVPDKTEVPNDYDPEKTDVPDDTSDDRVDSKAGITVGMAVNSPGSVYVIEENEYEYIEDISTGD